MREPTEMELRVAQALIGVHPTLKIPPDGIPAAWQQIPESLKDFMLQMARAAIRAMREPTPEMLDAVKLAWRTPGQTHGQKHMPGLKADYERLIDAASPPDVPRETV
jgi:hypothetical protein